MSIPSSPSSGQFPAQQKVMTPTSKSSSISHLSHPLDLTPRILLIATRASGDTTIFTIERSQSGVWEVRENPETTEGFSNPIPGGSVVIDIKGNKYKADRNGLAAALAGGEVERKRSIWINAGAKGVKCVGDITGDRLGKVEWGSKVGKVEQIAIVQKNGKFIFAN